MVAFGYGGQREPLFLRLSAGDMWIWHALVFAVFVIRRHRNSADQHHLADGAQIREASNRTRTQRLEKAIAEMNAKAAKLQIRPDSTAPTDTP